MKSVLLVTCFLIHKPWNCMVDAVTDPCSEDVYRILPRASYRGGSCPYDSNKQTCDAALITSWYRAVGNGKDLKMQEEEADLFTCGTKFPSWMDGTHPKPEEGIVTRTLLQAITYKETAIQVKNCNDEYYVYYLTPTAACPEAYCFGETEKDPCPPFDPCDIYEHQKIDYNPGQSSHCVSDNNEACSTTYEQDWVSFRGKDQPGFLNVSTRPVRSGACGSPSPLWIKEVESTDDEGIKTLQLCIGSDTSDCERIVMGRAKVCRWFTVYEVPKHVNCGRLCLEDPSASCAVQPVATTRETVAESTTEKSLAATNNRSQMTGIYNTTTQEHVTSASVSVSSVETSVNTSRKLPLTTETKGVTTEQGKSKTTPVIINDRQTGLSGGTQQTMVIAVAVAVTVIAIAIFILVIIAFRRKCSEQEKLQNPDPDDHYYLHIAEIKQPELEKPQEKDTEAEDHCYADIKDA